MTTTREWRDDPPAETGHWGAGAQLRATREAFGLSLEEVAQQLKLAPRQVIALEDEDFAQLPGRTFVRGFVRNYARLLNLDGDQLLGPDTRSRTGRTGVAVDRLAQSGASQCFGQQVELRAVDDSGGPRRLHRCRGKLRVAPRRSIVRRGSCRCRLCESRKP